MSLSPLCFLPAGLLLRCASAGLFPCFSADCLSGEIGVKIKSVNDENTIALPEGCGEKIKRKLRVIFIPGTSQPQRVYSCNFFLSFNRSSSRGFVTLNSEIVGFFFTNNLTPTDEGKDKKAG